MVAVPRVLALDVDGTLVGTNGRIGKHTRSALEHALRLGVRVVLASGRHPHAVATLSRGLGLPGFHVCLNGALVIDPVLSASLVARFILEGEVRKVIDLFHREGYRCALYRLQDIITDCPDLPPYFRAFGEDVVRVVPRLEEYTSGVLKVLGMLPQGGSVERARATLLGQLDRPLAVTSGDSVSVEVTDSLATKGEALKAVCLAEGFSLSEVVVVGDSYNDVDMFRVAGHGVAVANAVPELKELAELVVSSCDEDGVAEAVWYFWGNVYDARPG